MGKADLHTHTIASDGALTTRQLLEKAKEKGLETVSITDHDTIKGYREGKDIAAELGIELLPGVEITALWQEREIHLLAYLFDETREEFLSLLRNQKRARLRRMEAIVNQLKKNGLDVDMDEIRAESGFGNIGRPHAAAVLIQKGYVASTAEAFIRYLSSDKLRDIQTGYESIEQVVAITHRSGGIVSLAHPGPLYSENEIDELLACGLDGLECIHPSHSFKVQRMFTKKAGNSNLLVTGGSDYHGTGKSNYDPYFGIVTIGRQHVLALKSMAARRKKMI